ncbi:hypothetical protein V6N13_109873 [Hibiscus sabdariffa]|uniref:Uncharacterized protein n=1 Tax=Hibiscus sabdariffa TaxID=183260 RepID=A0ABR2FR63_9ROSI
MGSIFDEDVAQLYQGTNDDVGELEYEDTSGEEYEEPTLLDEVKMYFDISKPLELVGRDVGAPKTSNEEPLNLELEQLSSHLRYFLTSKVKGGTEPKHYYGAEFDQRSGRSTQEARQGWPGARAPQAVVPSSSSHAHTQCTISPMRVVASRIGVSASQVSGVAADCFAHEGLVHQKGHCKGREFMAEIS